MYSKMAQVPFEEQDGLFSFPSTTKSQLSPLTKSVTLTILPAYHGGLRGRRTLLTIEMSNMLEWLKSDLGGTIELKSAPSSPSRSPTPCRFKHSHLASRVSQGERRVSEGRAPRGSRARSPSIYGSKMDSLLYAILGSPGATASSRPCGSDRQILEGVEARSVMPAV
jgi:hypothetical protein